MHTAQVTHRRDDGDDVGDDGDGDGERALVGGFFFRKV